jgi:hypothetical protein
VRNGYAFALADVRTLLLREVRAAQELGDEVTAGVLARVEEQLAGAALLHADTGLTLPEQRASGR